MHTGKQPSGQCAGPGPARKPTGVADAGAEKTLGFLTLEVEKGCFADWGKSMRSCDRTGPEVGGEDEGPQGKPVARES